MQSESRVSYLKPFLKWVGGKSQIIDDVISRFPADIRDYHEPFVGGGSVLLALCESVQAGRICVRGSIRASDINGNLIHAYRNVQNDCEGVIAALEELVNDFKDITGTTVNRAAATREEAGGSKESFFYWVRARYNALTTEEQRRSPEATAMLIFLNKTCWRGVYREGPRGFNVPYGNYKNPQVYDADHLRAVSRCLRDVVFVHQPFAAAMDAVERGDFVYLDPPYAGAGTASSFTSYTAAGFAEDAHARLFAGCHDLSAKGVPFLLSNADVQLVRDAFQASQYHTDVISCRRAIHSKRPESKADEVLIHNRASII